MTDKTLVEQIADMLYPKYRQRQTKIGAAIDESREDAQQIIDLCREAFKENEMKREAPDIRRWGYGVRRREIPWESAGFLRYKIGWIICNSVKRDRLSSMVRTRIFRGKLT